MLLLLSVLISYSQARAFCILRTVELCIMHIVRIISSGSFQFRTRTTIECNHECNVTVSRNKTWCKHNFQLGKKIKKYFIYRPENHDDPAGWHTVLRIANESLQSGIELLPGVSVLPFAGPPTRVFWNEREGRHDDAIPEERRLHEIRLLDLRKQTRHRHVFVDEHGTAV